MSWMIIGETDQRVLFICPNLNHRYEIFSRNKAPRFHSVKHAQDAGWIFTTDSFWNRKGDVVAVCPECVNREKEIKK